MPSRMTIAGHPIHPFLVLFPVGLFAWALVSMIVYASNDNLLWYDISFWSSWAAIAAAGLAAIFGFADYFGGAREHVPQTATAHMLLNLAVTAAFIAAAVMMMDRGAIDGGRMTFVLILQAAGVLMLAVSGWLGGEMVYRHGMGVTREAAAEMQETRTAAGEFRRAGQPR